MPLRFGSGPRVPEDGGGGRGQGDASAGGGVLVEGASDRPGGSGVGSMRRLEPDRGERGGGRRMIGSGPGSSAPQLVLERGRGLVGQLGPAEALLQQMHPVHLVEEEEERLAAPRCPRAASSDRRGG